MVDDANVQPEPPQQPPPPPLPPLPPNAAVEPPKPPAYGAAAAPGNWWDGQARAYSDWMLWLHLCICQCPGLIVGLLFVTLCATEQGKTRGKQLLMYSGIGFAIAVVIRLIMTALQMAAHR